MKSIDMTTFRRVWQLLTRDQRRAAAFAMLGLTLIRMVLESVRVLRGDKTLVIVAHRLSTVFRCDWLFRLEQGRVVKKGKRLRYWENSTNVALKCTY